MIGNYIDIFIYINENTCTQEYNTNKYLGAILSSRKHTHLAMKQ